MTLYTSYYNSPLSTLRIQCTDNFITDVSFAEDLHEPADEGHPLLTKCASQLEEYFAGQRKTFDLPLQQLGSAFQQQAWELLHQVAFGKTISYMGMARLYGDVKAIRALASANGKNKIAIIVPCHRVIGSDQSLTGYAGGLWRKQWLLEHEAKWSGAAGQLGMF